jgi:hypothetical protein
VLTGKTKGGGSAFWLEDELCALPLEGWFCTSRPMLDRDLAVAKIFEQRILDIFGVGY